MNAKRSNQKKKRILFWVQKILDRFPVREYKVIAGVITQWIVSYDIPISQLSLLSLGRKFPVPASSSFGCN